MNPGRRAIDFIRRFLELEAAGGLILMVASAEALIAANTSAAPLYNRFAAALHGPVNDGLMTFFFLIAGLEIKRELLQGELAGWRLAALPGIAALGGMIVPALMYLAVTQGRFPAVHGWAIPTATDIAFALGVARLLGARVPVALKVFLTALAILDDLGAILIIAIFYGGTLNWLLLAAAAGCVGVGVVCNRRGVDSLAIYTLIGAAIWACLFKSGLHPTLAGVALAAVIPTGAGAETPLHRLEHGLHRWVAFLIVPLFGFVNAGLPLDGIVAADFTQPVTLAILCGLLFGKQLGVGLASWAAIRIGIARLPADATPAQFYAIAILCGIGFTMSLFVGFLAFPDTTAIRAVKLGVISGSLASALAGGGLLWLTTRDAKPRALSTQTDSSE